MDLPRGAPARKITTEMLKVTEQELSKSNELKAAQLLSVLKERHPTVDVSLATIKREHQNFGWVCTRPHYCQPIHEVSTISLNCAIRNFNNISDEAQYYVVW